MQRQGLDGLQVGSVCRPLGGQGLGLWVGESFGLVVSPRWARCGGVSLFGLLCEVGGGGRGDV